jgi:hypothetical protein
MITGYFIRYAQEFNFYKVPDLTTADICPIIMNTKEKKPIKCRTNAIKLPTKTTPPPIPVLQIEVRMHYAVQNTGHFNRL